MTKWNVGDVEGTALLSRMQRLILQLAMLEEWEAMQNTC
jgi:hypothetical protein